MMKLLLLLIFLWGIYGFGGEIHGINTENNIADAYLVILLPHIFPVLALVLVLDSALICEMTSVLSGDLVLARCAVRLHNTIRITETISIGLDTLT